MTLGYACFVGLERSWVDAESQTEVLAKIMYFGVCECHCLVSVCQTARCHVAQDHTCYLPLWELRASQQQLHFCAPTLSFMSENCHRNGCLMSLIEVIDKYTLYTLDSEFFLAVFTKLWKVAISFVMSIHLYVHPRGTTVFSLDGFSRDLLLEELSKICWENAGLIKIWQE